MLYFFHRDRAAILSHGLIKEKKVPSAEIDLAIERKASFERDPENRAHQED